MQVGQPKLSQPDHWDLEHKKNIRRICLINLTDHGKWVIFLASVSPLEVILWDSLMERIYGSIYFFSLPIKSQVTSWYNPFHMTSGSLDLFREGVHIWTTNSDSRCSNAYFSTLSMKQSIQPILNIYLGKSLLESVCFSLLTTKWPAQMRTSA